jgi:hypothetical protein
MRVTVSRYTKGFTPWGVFTNLLTPSDWGGEFLWYLHVHTPWVRVQAYHTTR